ncbi:MAG: VCBS repeat-containing protein [Gemmatimonadota bacterium]
MAPFPILDELGRPYDFPFLGGLLVPRIQLVDIDSDGTLDLFLQERSGELMFFENMGTPGEPDFRWRTDRFQGLDIGEWFRFVDLDADGRVDLLAEERYSHVRVFRNAGSPTDPRFDLIPDTLRDVSGEPIFADRQNIPSITDIDCDGQWDLFLGRIDGTLARYEEVDREGRWGLPRFQRVTERFEGIEIVGQFGSLHGANAMAWADITGSGGDDLIWGDFFEPSLLLLENTGSCPSFSIRSAPRLIATEGDPISTSGFNAPAFEDLNGDGRPDLFVGVLGGAFNPIRTASNNLHHYQQTEAGTFRLITQRFLAGLDVGSESTVTVADVTGNGLPDLVVGNKIDPVVGQTGRLYLFRNSGSPGAPSFQLSDTLSLEEVYHYAPAFGDLWGDGRAHLALGSWNRGVLFYRNTGEAGTLTLEADTTLNFRLTRGSHAIPTLGDVTGNGLLDLVVGRSSGELSYYRNVGSATAPSFELETDAFFDIDVGRRSAPTLVNLDGDGLLDLVVGREGGGAMVFRNRGTATEPDFPSEADEEWSFLPRNSTPFMVDILGTGRLQLLSGSLGGGVVFWQEWRQ